MHSSHLKTLTKTAAPEMLERFGVGFDTTAEMLIAAGDNTDRIRSEAAFVRMCGVCPIPTGSGNTNGRDRLEHRTPAEVYTSSQAA
jgi:transposase